jgi:hypothetical protein
LSMSVLSKAVGDRISASLPVLTAHDLRKERAEAHINEPCVGDYWHETFCPVCVVLSVSDFRLVICKHTTAFDDGWTWALDNRTDISRDEFKQWLAYKSIPGYWADVAPRAHKWVAEETA